MMVALLELTKGFSDGNIAKNCDDGNNGYSRPQVAHHVNETVCLVAVKRREWRRCGSGQARLDLTCNEITEFKQNSECTKLIVKLLVLCKCQILFGGKFP